MTTKADASMSPYERYEDELVTLLQMPGVDVKPLPKIEALELPRQTEKPQIFVLVNGTERGVGRRGSTGNRSMRTIHPREKPAGKTGSF